MQLPGYLQFLFPALGAFVLATTILGLPNVPNAVEDDSSKVAGYRGRPEGPLRNPDHQLVARGEIAFQHAFDIGNGWNMYYSSWPAAILPVQPAAWALVNLYVSIMLQAKTTWSKGPPQHGFTSKFGNIQLIMACPQQPIPWLFVERFSQKLLQITEGGWTGVYSVMLSQAANDVSIAVELRVVP